MNKVISVVWTLLVLIAFTASASIAQEVDTISTKDREFYLYSIEQLNSANQGLQEQLLENSKLLDHLQAENDSLRKVIDSLNSALLAQPSIENAPVEPEPKIPEPTLYLGESDFAEGYQQALEVFKQREYDQAITLFQALLARDRNNALSDNCQFWIGECYYAKKQYQKAIVEFEKVFAFTKSNKDDASQLKIGLCYLRLNDKESANRELTRLLSDYPNSEFAGTARKLLNELKNSKE